MRCPDGLLDLPLEAGRPEKTRDERLSALLAWPSGSAGLPGDVDAGGCERIVDPLLSAFWKRMTGVTAVLTGRRAC